MAPFSQPLRFVQNKVFRLIDSPDFTFQLPILSRSSWDTITDSNDERERLVSTKLYTLATHSSSHERQEFIGDSYMAATISENLYRILPEGSPFIYTVARSALTANSTFARLMNRLGFCNNQISTKSMGDAFESIIGAAHRESLKRLNRWFRTYYMQLLILTAETCRALPSKGKSAKPRPLLASIRLRSINHNSPVISRRLFPSPAGKKKLRGRLSKSTPVQFRPTIDLTIDSDEENSALNDNRSRDDPDIIQISYEEFCAISPLPRTNGLFDASATELDGGNPANPIIID
ncbi:hypothetical protein D9757_005349 [Collybiopsis confluens]|uniref:RNase III domain-containing protein n=1 Tax=Collybiopsis confluens TaxID=2823264 RepID=A0A8H5HLG2_9AGAR|nr:hypothetical protein D9757_005349 [Collybiopsis confluens]